MSPKEHIERFANSEPNSVVTKVALAIIKRDGHRDLALCLFINDDVERITRLHCSNFNEF